MKLTIAKPEAQRTNSPISEDPLRLLSRCNLCFLYAPTHGGERQSFMSLLDGERGE